MKKKLLVVFSFVSLFLNAQNLCENALPFCAGGISGVTFPASTGTAIGQSGPNYDCNGLVASPIAFYVPSPAWYYLQVGTSGSLDILIEGQIGVPPNNTPGSDVDFVCWGPFNSLSNVCNNLTGVNNVDCSYSPSYTETLNIPNGVAGQFYMIMITNFNNTPQNIVLEQIGGTGSTNCSILTNAAICAGTSTTVVTANSSSLTSPVYSMNPGAVTNSTGSFVVNPLVTTTYTTYVTGMNSQSVQVTQTSTTVVTVKPQPLATMNATQTTCTSTLNALAINLNFNPASPTPTYAIVWAPSVPAGITSPSQTSTSGNIFPATYTAVITAAGGCSTTATATINPIPAPSVYTLDPPGLAYTVSCIQPTVFLDAIGNVPSYNFTWTNGVVAPQSGSNTSYNQFGLGSWTVTGQNPNSGCFSSQVFSVSINQTAPVSAVSPSVQNILCGPGVVATATGTAINPTLNVTHSWYVPGIDVPVQGGGQYSIFSPPIGTSTYVLTNNINGCTTTKTVLVTSALGFPTYSVTSIRSFTLGCATRSFVDVHIVGQNTSPSGGAMSFTVFQPGFTSPSYTFGTVLDYTFTAPGNYTVSVRDNFNNCETRLTVPIIQDIFPPNLSASAITRTLTCATPSVILQAASTNTTPLSYQWAFTNAQGPGIVPSFTIPVSINNNTAVTGTVINNYTLQVTNLNNECKSTSVVPMYQNIRPPRPIINGAGALDCINSIQTLVNGSALDEASGFQPLVGTRAVRWEGPSPQEPKDSVASYEAKTVGIYTMAVMDRNNGCVSFTTALVGDARIYPVLETSSVVALDCGATGVDLKVTAIGLKPVDVTVIWVTPFPVPNIKNPTSLTLTTDGTGDYRLSVTTLSNGCSSRAYITVINGTLTGGFTADQDSGYAPLTVNFANTSTSSSTLTGTQSVTTVWSFGNGTTRTTSTSIGTSAIYAQPGTYTVTAFTSKGSCRDTVYRIIRVDIPSKLIVPNVFTPNGDNSNDIFFIKAANLTEITAIIYDRWGNKVYELTTDKGNIAWDGKTMGGKDAPDGTYFYIITAKGEDGVSYDKKGNVSLYR